jgi:hypothetical protein
MGRGLVEPNDDFRATNPPSNPELLDWLARDFAAGEFRLKRLVRRIMTSRVYQFAPAGRGESADGVVLHASALGRPLEAEQLLDALVQVTGVPVPFAGYPPGLRANQVPAPPQPGRHGSNGRGEQFLKTFGRPDRLLTCECERTEDPNLLQAFQLITGDLTHDLIHSADNRIGKHLSAGHTDAAILEDLYLAALCRRPTAGESRHLQTLLTAAPDRRAAWEDILWALVNSKEFLLRR